METHLGSKPGNLSISVGAAGKRSFPDIDDYMIFGSEYGTLSDELMKALVSDVPADSIDKFLSMMKSSWIDWNKIIPGEMPVYEV